MAKSGDPALTQAVCGVILAIDALVGAAQSTVDAGPPNNYQKAQLELARELLAKLQASLWGVLTILDDIMKGVPTHE